MKEILQKKVNASGFKKGHLAELIGIKPNHFYQCLSGNKRLSYSKEEKLAEILKDIKV